VVPYRDRAYSLKVMSDVIWNTISWEFGRPPLELWTLFVLTTMVTPLLRLAGLILLWVLPLTLRAEKRAFRALEILSAWSSLDVFLLTLVIMLFELRPATSNLFAVAIPNVFRALQALPDDLGDLAAGISAESGLFILVAAVVLDKLVAQFVFEQGVASIAERTAESSLMKAFGHHVDVDAAVIANAAEGLLETGAIVYFGPAERYLSALFPRAAYAGLPRSWWPTLCVRWGLLAGAADVDEYTATGANAPRALAGSVEPLEPLERAGA